MIILPNVTSGNKRKLILLGCCLFAVAYVGVGAFTLENAQLAPLMSWDAAIFFIPWTIVIYASQFAFVLLAVILAPNTAVATKTYYSYLLATLLATSIFILYPTKLARIDLSNSDMQGMCHYLYQFLYWSDVPNNCLPSLHTTLALLAANSLRQRQQGWQIIAPLWGLAIMGSTLTTKQHCILDVVAGMILFIICTWTTHQYYSKRQNGFVVFNHYPHRAVK